MNLRNVIINALRVYYKDNSDPKRMAETILEGHSNDVLRKAAERLEMCDWPGAYRASNTVLQMMSWEEGMVDSSVCQHETSKHVHTNEDGSQDVVMSCCKCGMEWG